MRIVITLSAVFILAGATGCSFVDSSKSISDSISSPSDWIKSSSASSSPDDEPEAAPETPMDQSTYSADVLQLAATFAKDGGDIGALRSAISSLAAQRGITNWEVDPTTVQGIGQGVAKGGMDDASFKKFSHDLFGEDLTKQNNLRVGYEKTSGS